MLTALLAPDLPPMDDYLLWLLASTGLALLAGSLWLRRRAARHQAELRAQAQRKAAERAEAERMAAEQRREAAEQATQAERERVAAVEAEAEAAREAQRLAAEQSAREEAARAETNRQAALHAEEQRLAVQRAEAERVEAERVEAERAEAERIAAELAAEQLELDRLAALQAERDATARAEAQRLAEQRAEKERIAAERAEAERFEADRIEAERATAAPRRVVKSAAQTLVLVADDSKVVRIKTGRLLAQHHYQVAYASDGLDAVQQMQVQMPDVLITDVEMPGLDGFELTRQLRADPQTAQLPVIMITAADDRHREQADAAGVSVLLGKPYPEDALIAHIRQALGQDAEAVLATGNSAHGALDALA
jgi:CheY-like chemotaxis protein